MSNQTSLFTEDAPVLPAHTLPPANALAISALKRGTAQATPAQKRFTQLVSQTETLAAQIITRPPPHLGRAQRPPQLL